MPHLLPLLQPSLLGYEGLPVPKSTSPGSFPPSLFFPVGFSEATVSQNINEMLRLTMIASPRDAGALVTGWTGWGHLGRCDEPVGLVERTSLWQEQTSNLALLYFQ